MSSTKTESPRVLPSFSFAEVSHEQLRSICEKVAEKWKKAEVKPTTVKVALNGIEQTLPIHLKALYRAKGSDYTMVIKGDDRNRDRANSMFFNKVMIASNEWEESIAQAGAKLKEVIRDTVGIGLNDLAYDVQTSKTDDLIAILSSAENQQRIELCGLVEDYNRVVSFNNTFKESYEKKVQDESGSEIVPPIKELSVSLQRDLRKILDDTEYLYSKNHPSVDSSLFNDIHTYVKDLVTLINRSN